MVGGVFFFSWCEIWDNRERTGTWPDGGSLLAQPSMAVDVMNAMSDQIQREQKKDAQRS